MNTSATVSISHLSTTDSSAGRFYAALSLSLFRDAAGALEARLDSETTLTVSTKALSPIVTDARGDGQWDKAAGCSGTCLKTGTSDSRRRSGSGKGAGDVTKRGCPSEMTA